MLLRLLSILLLLAMLGLVPYVAHAQSDSTSYSKKKLDGVEVNLLYGYYEQNGFHSAVMGGVGSEKLDVNAPSISLVIPLDTNINLHFEGGMDIVTSASTDKIDFVMSSASYRDGHHHAKLGFDHDVNKQWNYGIAYSYSMESDYFSNGAHFDVSRLSKDRNTQISLSAKLFFDYVTWGWHRGLGSVKLIYPEELRYKEWETEQNRYSYNFNLSVTHNITKRLKGGLYFSPAYQHGLLSTPFHRVYLNGVEEAVVEHLPYSRLKLPVGVRANYFVLNSFILKMMYRFYWDDHGVVSQMAGLEVPVKFSAFFSVYPFYRFYTQTASDYFAPYDQHSATSEFHTSDNDLSAFQSHKFGIGLRLAPPNGIFRFSKKDSYAFRSISLRYAHYLRTDGLSMHIFTSAFSFGR